MAFGMGPAEYFREQDLDSFHPPWTCISAIHRCNHSNPQLISSQTPIFHLQTPLVVARIHRNPASRAGYCLSFIEFTVRSPYLGLVRMGRPTASIGGDVFVDEFGGGEVFGWEEGSLEEKMVDGRWEFGFEVFDLPSSNPKVVFSSAHL